MLNNVYKTITIILGIMPCLILSSIVTATPEPIVMSYWENWATYQHYPMPNNAHGSKNTALTDQIKNINALAYTFLIVGNDGSLQFSDTWSDLDPNSEQDKNFCTASPSSCIDFPQKAGLGNFDAFTKTAIKHHFISVGGAGQDRAFEKALEHPDKFVSSLKALVETYPIDALDIDYEPEKGVPTAYVQRFIALTDQIKAALPSITLSYAIIANKHNIEKFGAENWKKLGNNLNYISIMGYDMHGAFERDNPHTALHSALMTQDEGHSIESTLQALNKVGISNDKIILGMPLYGRAVGGVTSDGIGQVFTQGVKGDMDPDNCSIQLNAKNLCGGNFQYKTLVNQSYAPVPVTVGHQITGAYSYNANTKVFVSFDSPESAAAKAQYAINNHLAGVMFWALRFDKPVNDPQSILAAVTKVYGQHS